MHLDVYVHPSMNYPAKIPLALLRCPRLRARGVLLNVQSLVWNKLHELRGDSVIFALASWIQDELPDKVAYSLDKRSLSQLPEAGLGTLLAQEACTMWPSSQVHFEALVAGPSGDKGVEQKEDNVVATAKRTPERGRRDSRRRAILASSAWLCSTESPSSQWKRATTTKSPIGAQETPCMEQSR